MTDDREEEARSESISKIYKTKNIWPSSLSHPLVLQPGNKLQDEYYIKAIVPVCCEQLHQINNADKPSDKPKFKKIK